MSLTKHYNVGFINNESNKGHTAEFCSQIKLSFPNNLVLASSQLILYSEDLISDLDFLELSITTTPEIFCENFRRGDCYFEFTEKTEINKKVFYEPRNVR